MKPTKRIRMSTSRLKDLKKPFGFCCETSNIDPETQYDMRNPPFESSFAETPVVTNHPELQFRVQDNAKIPALVSRIVGPGVYREDVEIKKTAAYGRSKKGRGPLMWFLEDEIEAAQNILAEEKKVKWEKMHEKKIKKPKHRNSDKIIKQDNESRIIETGPGNNETQ